MSAGAEAQSCPERSLCDIASARTLQIAKTTRFHQARADPTHHAGEAELFSAGLLNTSLNRLVNYTRSRAAWFTKLSTRSLGSDKFSLNQGSWQYCRSLQAHHAAMETTSTKITASNGSLHLE